MGSARRRAAHLRLTRAFRAAPTGPLIFRRAISWLAVQCARLRHLTPNGAAFCILQVRVGTWRAALRQALHRLAAETAAGWHSVSQLGEAPPCGLPLPIGMAPVDELLGGGVPRRLTSLLCGEAGAGKTTLALQWVAAAQRLGQACVWLEGRGALDVGRLPALGVDPNLLWVCRPAPSRAVAVAHALLQGEPWGLVVLDGLTGACADTNPAGAAALVASLTRAAALRDRPILWIDCGTAARPLWPGPFHQTLRETACLRLSLQHNASRDGPGAAATVRLQMEKKGRRGASGQLCLELRQDGVRLIGH